MFSLALFILNIVQATTMDLSHDEAYYWIYSQFPALGYYDHPPMVAWMISAGEWIGRSEFAVRLPFALMQAGLLWVLWLLAGCRNSVVFASASLAFPLLHAAGFLALPDTPLLFFSTIFWLLAIWYRDNEKSWHPPVIAIVLTGLLYSKYQGFAVALLTAAAMPGVFKRKSFWLTIVLTCFFCLPHLIWQHQHDYISAEFHLSQRSGKGFSFENVLSYAGGQLILGGIFPLILIARYVYKFRSGDRVLVINSFGMLGLIFLLSFRNRIEANWTATAYAALIPLAATALKDANLKKAFAIACAPAVLAAFIFRFALMLPYPEGRYPIERFGEVKNWRAKAHRTFVEAQGRPVFAETYQIASKLSFYGKKLVPALELRSRKSQFSLIEREANIRTKISKNGKITFVDSKRSEGAVEIKTGYKGPLFVIPSIKLEELFKNKKKAL